MTCPSRAQGRAQPELSVPRLRLFLRIRVPDHREAGPACPPSGLHRPLAPLPASLGVQPGWNHEGPGGPWVQAGRHPNQRPQRGAGIYFLADSGAG